MCGIAGAFALDGNALPPDCLRPALAALAHRGPDGEGYYQSGSIALAHRRLAIMDPEGGRQPLHSSSGDLSAVVNGEFYGFKALRSELSQRGYVFKSQSDSEVILGLYQEYGLPGLKKLRGEFAYLLWDGKLGRLIAGRDRFGIKPLFYAQKGSVIYFSSEIAALFRLGISPQWDLDTLLHGLKFQYLTRTGSLFSGIKQVSPANYLLVSSVGALEYAYWRPNYPEKATISDFSEAQSALKESLSEAVSQRLTSDVPVTSLLSGGLDSTVVTTLAHRLGRIKEAFSVSFEHQNYDEAHLAQKTADTLGLKLNTLRIDGLELMQTFDQAVLSASGMVVNPHISAKYLLSRFIKDAGYRVVLSGEGADEMLAGYPHFRDDLWRLKHSLGDGEALQQLSELKGREAVTQGVLLSREEVPGLEAFKDTLGFVPGLVRAKAGLGERIKPLLHSEFQKKHQNHSIYHAVMDSQMLRELQNRPPLSKSMLLTQRLSLASYILLLFDDAQEMAHGLEARLPFLDHRVQAVCKQFPAEFLIEQTVEKHVMREAFKAELTEEVYARRKHPFYAPPFLLDTRKEVQDYILDRLSHLPEFWDQEKVLDYYQQAQAGSDDFKVAAEPVISMALCTAILSEGYKVSLNSFK